MKNSPATGKKFAFEAVLENWAEGMDYCAVPVPPEITQALGTKGPVLVMARVNDSAPFQVSLFPVGGGQHSIRIKNFIVRQIDSAAKPGTSRKRIRESVDTALSMKEK